jgi:hypothetical protein
MPERRHCKKCKMMFSYVPRQAYIFMCHWPFSQRVFLAPVPARACLSPFQKRLSQPALIRFHFLGLRCASTLLLVWYMGFSLIRSRRPLNKH